MNQEIKEKWVAALTSREYFQVHGALRMGTGFCCLGVLCDLYLKENGDSWERPSEGGYGIKTKEDIAGLTVYRLETGLLTKEVMDWAGLHEKNPAVVTKEQYSPENLIKLNDSGYTFKDIANIIDTCL